MRPKQTKLVAFVTVKCIGCKTLRDIREDEIEPGDQPMCDRCYLPMITIKATVREVHS